MPEGDGGRRGRWLVVRLDRDPLRSVTREVPVGSDDLRVQRYLTELPAIPIQRIEQRALGLLYTEIQSGPGATRTSRKHRCFAASSSRRPTHTSRSARWNGAALAQVREGAGHLDRAKDLIALAGLVRAAWPGIAAKTQATRQRRPSARCSAPEPE